MGGNKNCGKIFETYTQLTWLQGEFDAELLKSLKENKFERCRAIEAVIETKLSEIREMLTPREIREALNASREFFVAHGLGDLAERLPAEIKYTPEVRAKLERAREQGFDQYFVMPGANIDVKKLLPLATYSGDTIQITGQESLLVGHESLSTLKQRDRLDTPYIVCYSSSDVPTETKGRDGLTYSEAIELFKVKGWNGLTFQEYLILQNLEYEKNGYHAFDEWDMDDESRSNWTWLLDSQILDAKGNPKLVLDVRWDLNFNQAFASFGDGKVAYSALGARPTVIISLENKNTA